MNNRIRPASRPGRHIKQEGGEEEENIYVVVRCRERNEREKSERQAQVVSVQRVTGREVHVHVAGTRRTYTFDRVFGPGATQEAIYKDVAAPMLEELLNGYNCTIFAYGQTGTGKTYTMQGELDDLDSRNAGIIPRILHNLFKRLADMPGSIVNLSYAELYNEKLRDLLSPSDDGTRLRIYEDPSTRETTIDGLKIVSIESTQEGLELLRQGSEKRQVAATKCNMNSSRSHAILTLKVVVPSKGQTGGEKLFKVGKLHLVDLAGSESIGRSGAENKHAREAGMINQSLLTLGRVIKARAERAPHIPYRESKLTRFLRDSLGGSTKTRIIATISPAESSTEETIGTLEYASQAKDIRNKPEVNQLVDNESLLKERETRIKHLEEEMEKILRKEGIHLTAEEYDQYRELAKTHEQLKEQYNQTLNEFEEHKELHAQTLNELEECNTRLTDMQRQLEEKDRLIASVQANLRLVKQNLAEQKVLTEAHAATEECIDKAARGLKDTLKVVVNDVDSLHAKVDRKARVEEHNHRVIQSLASNIDKHVSDVESLVARIHGMHTENTNELRDNTRSFLEQRCKKLDDTAKFSDRQFSELMQSQSLLQTQHQDHAQKAEDAANSLQAVHSVIGQTSEKVEAAQRVQTDGFSQNLEQLTALQGQSKHVHDILIEHMREIAVSAKRMVEAHMAAIDEMESKRNAELEAERERLEQYKTHKKKVVQDNIQAANVADDALLTTIANLSRMIIERKDQREQEMRTMLHDDCEMIDKTSSYLSGFIARQTETNAVIKEKANASLLQLQSTMNDLVGKIQSNQNVLSQAIITIQCAVEQGKEIFIKDSQAQLEQLNTALSKLTQLSENMSMQRSILDQQAALLADQINHSAVMSRTLKRDFATMQEDEMTRQSAVEKMLARSNESIGTHYSDLSTRLQQTRDDTMHMVENDIQKDIPTGQTPARRKYNVSHHWERTRPHAEIIKQFREAGHIPTSHNQDALTEDGIVNTAYDQEVASDPIVEPLNGFEEDDPRVSRSLLHISPVDDALSSNESMDNDAAADQPEAKRRRHLSPPRSRLSLTEQISRSSIPEHSQNTESDKTIYFNIGSSKLPAPSTRKTRATRIAKRPASKVVGSTMRGRSTRQANPLRTLENIHDDTTA